MKKFYFVLIFLLLASFNTVKGQLEHLPLLPQGDIQSKQFSSHSPHQQNGDSEHFLYKDEHGDAVIFDVKGAGCITNIWGTVFDPEGILKFYYDGEKEPRYAINIIDFFKGKHPSFPSPFLSYERRGYYLEDSYAGNSFLPIPFTKSLKISIEGKPTFYHILYETYSYSTPIEKYAGDERMNFIKSALNDKDGNRKINVAEKEHSVVIDDLEVGHQTDLLKISGHGTVHFIEIEMDDHKELLQNLRLLMIWDEKNPNSKESDETKLAFERNENSLFYHVNTPIGFFFATPDKVNELQSLPISVVPLTNGRVRLTFCLPMPYWKSARISIHNKSNIPSGLILSKIITTYKQYPKKDTGYFMTHYRKGLTEYGQDWVFARMQGTGHFIGVVQSCRLEHYCEGNEHFYMDGNRTPQINGTGTEDYYLGCFWPNLPYHTPFAGCVNDVRKEGGGDTGKFLVCLPTDYLTAAVYYRFHLEMPLPFYSSMEAYIQHGGENKIESEYASLAYFYLKEKPVMIQTDYLDVSNSTSVKMHHYKSTGKKDLKKIRARYEGNELQTNIEKSGFYHQKGEITFKIAIDKENRGVRMRRQADQSISRQQAEVYIDGEYAGTWYDPQNNHILSWYDSEFNIHSNYTQGKESLDVKLIIIGDQEYNFTDFEYIILSNTDAN